MIHQKDWYSVTEPEGMTRMITTKKAVLSVPLMIPRPDDPVAVAEAEGWCGFFKAFIPRNENCMEPVSVWYYPIIANLSINDISEFNGVNGMITSAFYWRNLIRDMLPPESKGIILVFSNSCVKNSFTYQINGPSAIYLGVGDLHNREYDGMTLLAGSMEDLEYQAEDSRYIGLRADDQVCTYTFQVYPSDEMKESMQTNQGIIFAVSAVAFIVFPFVVFLAYEHRVSRQQKLLMSSAQRSNAIVESLFPSNVRDKLYPHDENGITNSGTPIADLHPDTTVIFAGTFLVIFRRNDRIKLLLN
jgi:hypothetical protein